MAHLDYRIGKGPAVEGKVGVGEWGYDGLWIPCRLYKWVSDVWSTLCPRV